MDNQMIIDKLTHELFIFIHNDVNPGRRRDLIHQYISMAYTAGLDQGKNQYRSDRFSERAVILLDDYGKEKRRFKSAKQAANYFDIRQSSITKVLTGHNNSIHGMRFKYADTEGK